MAEVVSVRIFLFFVAFFALRPLMLMLLPRANRIHALGLLGVSTLIAFAAGALLLDDPMAETLTAWLVIYAIIAVLWFFRWKGGDNAERWRRQRRELYGPAEEPAPSEPRD